MSASAFATVSSAGATAAVRRLVSPSQIRLSLAMASPVRSICAASAALTATPKSCTSCAASRSVRGVDAQEGERRPVAEQVGRHGGALGLGHEPVQRVLNGDDALVERQGLQLGGRQVQALQRADGGARSGCGLGQPGGQLLGGLFDLPHRDARQFPGPGQHLQAFDGGLQRGRHVGLRADGVEARADHRHARGGRGGGHGGERDPGLAGEAAEPGVGQLHLGGQAAEAPRAGLADTFQFGADLTAAFRDQADTDPLLSHGRLRSVR